MRISTPLKIGLVSTLSSLTLLLSMLFTAGTVSAHSTSTLHNQTSLSKSVDDRHRPRCRTFVIVRDRFRGFADHNGKFISNRHFLFHHGQRGFFLFDGHKRIFHRVFPAFFEKVTIVTICHGHHSEKTIIRRI